MMTHVFSRTLFCFVFTRTSRTEDLEDPFNPSQNPFNPTATKSTSELRGEQ